MINKCTVGQFLKDVKDHGMTIIADCDEVRHVAFGKPETACYGFNLTTWPGYLCISGDMGTYVFARIPDMFEFFRSKTLEINPGYWSEKVVSNNPGKDYEAFSEEKFKAKVGEWFNDWKIGRSREVVKNTWEEIKRQIWDIDNEHDVYLVMEDFVADDGSDIFNEFWRSGDLKDYTYRFIWCLYAIVWGIQQYDSAKEGVKK